MPGGSGLLEQMLSRWKELIATARELLAGCAQGCETACYSCFKTFRNQFYHPILDRHKAHELMDELDHEPQHYRDIVPVFEEERPGGGTPSNKPEARLVALLHEHHFPAGECRKKVSISGGLSTEPDWLHEPTKVAVYLDGMSRALHGDPKTAQRDQLIRGMLELDGYTVIVVQSRDLNDPQAVRQHLRNIAQAIGRTDLPVFNEDTATSVATEDASQPSELDDRLKYCDERCRDVLRACADQGGPLPEVGYELQDEQGRVCAEAELAWPSKQVALTLPEQAEAGAEFVAQGWKVFSTEGEQQKLLDALKE
jgi:hypothetical protein